MPSNVVQRGRAESCAIRGVRGMPISVEIEIGNGLPGWHIIGMGDTSVQEARLRVKSALKAAGFEVASNRHIVVNLAPASLKKAGSGFDLAIACAFLVATGQIPRQLVEGRLIVGELSLDGAVNAIDGLFACALCARDQKLKLLSGQPQTELPALDGLDHACIEHLRDLRSGSLASPHKHPKDPGGEPLDFCDVVGQEHAVRALAIAAAGNHGLLMVGPPGSGKSMLARRLPSIMPPLTERERIETALIHSVAGLDVTSITNGVRPFRSPHHSATTAALVGGGTNPIHPGEASLAHHGVLFLDELGEFNPSALQALRQPLEEGEVSLCRADGRYVFPAQFQLIAATNPCPCGYLGDRDKACKCTDVQIERYQAKLGGPIRDRIDLSCDVNRIDPAKVLSSGKGTSSHSLAQRVLQARERSRSRKDLLLPLAVVAPKDVIDACGLNGSQRALIEQVARRHRLSGRGIVRTLRVARTIADLEDAATVGDDHLLEALTYRVEGEVL